MAHSYIRGSLFREEWCLLGGATLSVNVEALGYRCELPVFYTFGQSGSWELYAFFYSMIYYAKFANLCSSVLHSYA